MNKQEVRKIKLKIYTSLIPFTLFTIVIIISVILGSLVLKLVSIPFGLISVAILYKGLKQANLI